MVNAFHRVDLCNISATVLVGHILLVLILILPFHVGTHRRTALEIHQYAAREIYNYCHENGYIDAWVYLYTFWYKPTAWNQWARSAIPDRIPGGKTTMLIEAHWKVLKRNHLYRFNRARLDLLVFVIIEKHFPDLRVKYNRDTVQFRQATRWQQAFVNHWNKAYRLPENSNANALYQPTVDTWTCGCKAYLTSRFLICKHLVKRSGHGEIPASGVLVHRQSTQPFIRIRPWYENVFSNMRLLSGHVPAPASITFATTTATSAITPTISTTTTSSIIEISDNASVGDVDSFHDQHEDDDSVSPTTTSNNENASSVIVDREADLLRRELQMQRNRQQRRELALRMQQLDDEYEDETNMYRYLIPANLNEQFEVAETNNTVDTYLTRVIRERRRRTIPTTYSETDRYTRHV
ncbi:hypothetical protein BDB00DRAFT_963242 [Zychaea mexicana]|uniref:uncharacterized protein n=1 Tax=Zychaea mexicana TaxID=64656 RepID=UPI0022FE1F79|nr:uncharacterized protein BDB00DRAFT_963242 [Zychaea mexicana]KAI9488736.1 hypothetical protein BDB00DRAFT_963242 [Zychaea mexicana]